MVACYCSGTLRLAGMCPSSFLSRFTGVLLAQCYSPDSLADDRHVRCWVMDACPSMSARALCHMDASDTIIYVSQKAQTVPGNGKATPMGIPCDRGPDSVGIRAGLPVGSPSQTGRC
ncbi:hypothetical protein T12_14755 [Trichinella patagoniensis]|uniref:Uncharacterized protein n=1 Tax=Trichinella patagoniensis TaxID=990121 RepID=A0A0V0Z2L0_9BILA|nr:hypothetical protein T12_14755 [Trichinella patagoniensis]